MTVAFSIVVALALLAMTIEFGRQLWSAARSGSVRYRLEVLRRDDRPADYSLAVGIYVLGFLMSFLFTWLMVIGVLAELRA